MTTTDLPLPPSLALSDGEPEPVSEAALDWLERQIAAARDHDVDITIGDVLDYADDLVSEPESELASRSVAEDHERAAIAEAKRLAGEVRWEIDGTGSAQWAMAKLAAVEAEAAEIEEQAKAWSLEIERWRVERQRPLAARSAFFTERLTSHLRRLREADPKKKSVPLPSGTIQSRTVAPKVEVTDADTVAAWAHAAGHTEVLKVTTSVLVGELKKIATIDGEALVARDPDDGMPIPGTAVTPGGVSYSVKVG